MQTRSAHLQVISPSINKRRISNTSRYVLAALLVAGAGIAAALQVMETPSQAASAQPTQPAATVTTDGRQEVFDYFPAQFPIKVTQPDEHIQAF